MTMRSKQSLTLAEVNNDSEHEPFDARLGSVQANFSLYCSHLNILTFHSILVYV